MPRLHTRARSQLAAGADGGRGGRRRGRGVCSCSGVAFRRRLGRLLSPGSAAAATWLVPSRSLSPASQAAGKKLGPALQRPPRRVGRAVGALGLGRGPAAPRVTRLLGGPSPGRAARRRRGRGPSGPSESGPAPGACAGPSPCRGVSRVRPAAWTQRSSPAGRPAAAPWCDVATPPTPPGRRGRPARSEVGRRKLSAGWGGAQLEEEGVKFREAAG